MIPPPAPLRQLEISFEARSKLPAAITLLNDGILVVGGAASAEIYSPKAHSFAKASGTMDTAHYPAMIQLLDGSVRIFGGEDASGVSTAKTWIYH